jgi:hypothetical protein
MGADAHAPAKVLDCIIYTLLPGMTDTLQGISANGAGAGGLVTRSHVYGVCGMSKVKTAGELALL